MSVIRCLLWGVPSDVCYEVAHYQVPSKKQGMYKVYKNSFRCRCVRRKANPRDIFFATYHGYQLMFDWAMQDLKMNELVLFNNIFVQLFSSLLGSFFLAFSSRSLSITLFTLEATSEAYLELSQTSKMEDFCINS